MLPNDPAERRVRVALAGHRGDTATIREHTDDPDWKVRTSALLALARAGTLEPSDLDRASSDPRPEVRMTAAELASRTAEPSLVALLADPDPRVVEVACWSAGERVPPEPGTVNRLGAIATSHPDALCRESAIAALGAIGDDAGLAAIIGGLEDKPAVRRRAVVALAPFEGPEVDAALARARHDRDRQVRETVEELFGAVPPAIGD